MNLTGFLHVMYMLKSVPIEWMKMKSRQYYQKMMVLFGVSSLEELKGVVGKCVYDSTVLVGFKEAEWTEKLN